MRWSLDYQFTTLPPSCSLAFPIPFNHQIMQKPLLCLLLCLFLISGFEGFFPGILLKSDVKVLWCCQTYQINSKLTPNEVFSSNTEWLNMFASNTSIRGIVCVDQITLSPKGQNTTWNRTEEGSKDDHTALVGGKALKGTSVCNENESDVTKEERILSLSQSVPQVEHSYITRP